MRVSVVAAGPHGAARKGEDGREEQDVVVHRATERREYVGVCQRCSVVKYCCCSLRYSYVLLS